MTYTSTQSKTFTIVHARQIASKVAADMHLCSRFYGKPTEEQIRNYAEELAQYLNNGYLAEYEFGFKRDEVRVVCWRYKAVDGGTLNTDDRPGGVIAHVDVSGATFYNFLTWSSRFSSLAASEREKFKSSLPIQRIDGELPSDGSGYWTADRAYSSSGRGLGRQTFQRLA